MKKNKKHSLTMMQSEVHKVVYTASLDMIASSPGLTPCFTNSLAA